MQKGLWIRLDVPYSRDATKMRGVLAYTDPSDPDKVGLAETSDCKNIPEAVDKLFELAKDKGIAIDSSLTIVYPLDARHGLAYPAKETAEKKSVRFSRHIPDIMKLPVDLLTAYEIFDTGSSEDTASNDDAQRMVLDLNQEAVDSCNSGDLLEAMGPLRHALWLVLRHFGWHSPGTVYTLRNLGAVLNATGNDENRAETLYLIGKLVYQCAVTPPHKAEWQGQLGLLDSLVELCNSMGSDMGEFIIERKKSLE
jgi:hypothetical protein